MKVISVIVGLATLLLSVLQASAANMKDSPKERARIVKYISAVTFDVVFTDRRQERISLYGIRTATPDDQLNVIAKQEVEGMVVLFGPEVELEMIEPGKAKMTVGGFYVQDELVRKCLAVPADDCEVHDRAKWNFFINNACIPGKAGLWREMPK